MKRMVFTLGLLVILTVVVALAASAAPEVQVLNGPRIPVREGTSLNWAGYVVETNLASPQNYVVTDVKGQWVVPSVNATTGNTYSAVWVGIDGYDPNSSKTVEQIGTEQDYVKGTARYYAWYEMYPAASHLIKYSVYPGDNMKAEVQYSNGQFVLTLTNVTEKWTYTTAQKLNKAVRDSAEWIVEAPGNIILPLAEFGTVTFSGAQATINNITGPIDNKAYWQNDAITMNDPNGGGTATPSRLFDSHGVSSFSVTRN